MELESKGEADLHVAERYLIVGLGNPGRGYRNNRHNLGFMVLDRFAEQHDIKLARMEKKAITGSGKIAGNSVIVAKPQTFMNRSGEAVGSLVRYYKVQPGKLLVIYDEIDLPLGTIRIREKGGSGGHNGMKSIINHIGQDFARMRLGVGRPRGRMEAADFVLRNFHESEYELVDEMMNVAVKAIATYLTLGMELAMTHYNRNDVALG